MATITKKKPASASTMSGLDALGGLATVATKTAAAKTEKETIMVTDPKVAAAINSFVTEKEKEKAAKAAKEKNAGIIKPFGTAELLKHLKGRNNNESFILATKENGVLFYMSDAYKKLDEDRAAYLADTYGPELVETNTLFTINPDLVQEYGAAIAKAIRESKDIPADMKGLIIQKSETKAVAKGVKDRLVELAAKFKTTVETLASELKPTVGLKVRGEE